MQSDNGTNDSSSVYVAGDGGASGDGVSDTLIWVVLGHCCASIVVLAACLFMLRRRPFSRYRLGCLLIVRWNCAADLLCLLNKACFTVLNRPDLLMGAGRHLTAWVCKLYHFADNATMTLQIWLLVLFALERAAMSLNAGFALKHFSAFRLRIGAAAAGAVALAGHLNYIWMFSIVSPHGGRRGLAEEDPLLLLGNRSDADGRELQQHQQQHQQLVCGVLPEFHMVYTVSVVLEVVFNAYAPALVCGVCTVLVLLGCLRSSPGQRLDVDGAADVDGGGHSRQPQQLRRSPMQHQQPPLSYESADLVNACARALFLVLAVACYPPLAATGAFKARSVHMRAELSEREYTVLYYILQPMKNVLSAIAYFAFVCCVMLTHKHAALRRLLPHRYKQQQQQQQQQQRRRQQQHQEQSCSETEIPLRPMKSSSGDDCES